MLLLLIGALLAPWAAEAAANDSPKIDRSLVREPKYAGKPQYFLLIFGPEAKTRIWCVLDGSTLYIDRNGDGDLTAPSERFTLEFGRLVDVGDITETDGKTVHRHLRMQRQAGDKDQPEVLWITIEVQGEHEMISLLRMDEASQDPQGAPFRHFHGPLTFVPLGGERAKLVRGEEPENLGVSICTCYLTGEAARQRSLHARGVMSASIQHKGLPPEVHPVAEISFPGKTPDAKPIVVKVPLTKRC